MKYNVDSVLSFLKRKKGVSVDGNVITIKAESDAGNKTLGRIDFLCKVYGFILFVEKPVERSNSYKRKKVIEHVKTHVHSNADLLNLPTQASRGKDNKEYYSEHYQLVASNQIVSKFRPNFNVPTSIEMIVSKKEGDRNFGKFGKISIPLTATNDDSDKSFKERLSIVKTIFTM